MPTDKTSPEWTKEQVVEDLLKTGSDAPVSVQVFLSPAIPSDEVETRALEILGAAAARFGRESIEQAAVGKFHKLSRSLSLEARPSLIAELATSSEVSSILRGWPISRRLRIGE